MITCEHNFTSNRKKIKELLNYWDFINVLPGLSNFDDWYINKNFIDEMNISFWIYNKKKLCKYLPNFLKITKQSLQSKTIQKNTFY